MTSRSASYHGNPAGIAVSLQKGTTSKGMGANRNFSKWLSYGRGILRTFGYHQVQVQHSCSILFRTELEPVWKEIQ